MSAQTNNGFKTTGLDNQTQYILFFSNKFDHTDRSSRQHTTQQVNFGEHLVTGVDV